MTGTASFAKRSSAARPASWWNTPARRPDGFRSSFPMRGPPTRGSARPFGQPVAAPRHAGNHRKSMAKRSPR